MPENIVVIVVLAAAYLCLRFAVRHFADKKGKKKE